MEVSRRNMAAPKSTNTTTAPFDDDIDFIMTSHDHNISRKAKSDRELLNYKRFKTGVYLLETMCFGIVFCMLGTTLPDLLHRISIDNEQYGMLKIIENVIASVFGLTAGILADRYQHRSDLIVAMALLILGLSQISLAWCQNQYTALVLMTLMNCSGFTAGTTGTGYVIAMWGQKAKVAVHMMYLGFPLGCTIGPLLAEPFISERNKNDHRKHECNGNVTNSNEDAMNLSSKLMNNSSPCVGSSNDIESSIEIPYGISGGILVLLAMIFMLFHLNVFKMPETFELQRKPHTSLRDTFNPKLWNPDHPRIAVTVYVLIVLFYCLLNAVEDPLTNLFLFTNAVKGKYKFQSSEAAYLDTSFKASMLVGRLVIIPISFFCSIKVMLFAELILSLAMSICLATLGNEEKVYFWLFLCLLNFALAPLWPGVFAWANRYVVLYTSMIALCDVFIRLSDGLFSWIVGYIIDNHHPSYMWTLLSGCFGVMLLLFTVAHLISSSVGERFGAQTELVTTVDENELLGNEFSDDDENAILLDSQMPLDVTC